MSELLTVQEAAAILRVDPVTVRRALQRGDIAGVRIGKLWRVDPASIAVRHHHEPEVTIGPRQVASRPARGHFSAKMRDLGARAR